MVQFESNFPTGRVPEWYEVIEKPLYPSEVNDLLRRAGHDYLRVGYIGTTTSLVSITDSRLKSNYQIGVTFEEAEHRISHLLKKKIKLVRFY